MPLTVDIVTAEQAVYSDSGVEELVAPTVLGEITVLPSHAPLMTMVEPGVLRIVKRGEEIEMAVSGGFLEVREDRVTILADTAERAEEIDVARAEQARREAQESLHARGPGVDLVAAEANLRRSLARIRAVERRRRRTGPGGPPTPGVS
ncbi:MAG TPA: F0F1 ATP synthase subunit epsilon [Dehalococcoidia bacterium]|nr:F0F1 ATP synthase subunit epsilon [Dehalococcoidia bacterium]